jgi:hypothetical protein
MEIMVLNDGETFTDLGGCMRAEVLWHEDYDGYLDEEAFDQKIDDFCKEVGVGNLLWVSEEYGIIAKVVEKY